MNKKDIQCIFIGQQSKLYSDLVRSLCKFDINVQVKLVDAEKNNILFALKKLRGSGLVFISDDIKFSLDVLSDLIWQYAPDAVVVVLTTDKNSLSSSTEKPINPLFSKLHFESASDKSQLFLQCLIQTVKFKTEFRRCKRLLGVSEKRCLWLVDSSQEAIAYITKDLHLYANTSYLTLFNAESSEKLRSISIKDLIGSKEYLVFRKFLESQLKSCDTNRSLVFSMKKCNGVKFRANIHLIPSVYKGKKCLQLWVSELDKFDDFPKINSSVKERTNDDDVDELANMYSPQLEKDIVKAINENIQTTIPNPFSVLNEGAGVSVEAPKVDPFIIIVELLEKKEVALSAQKLVIMKKNEQMDEHLQLSLVINGEQKKGIESLLFEPLTATLLRQKYIFWDKVKFTRLFQILRKKSKLDTFLVIDVSVASIADRAFTQWFVSEVARLGAKSSRLVFLLPSKLKERELKLVINFSKKLKGYRCKVALNNSSMSNDFIKVLKYIRPSYIHFSSDWIKQMEGDDNREISLGSAIRQFESKNIRVIAPCGASLPMRKVFTLAGASFCQEKAIK